MIHFTQEQMQEVQDRYEQWWNKKSDRIVGGGAVRHYAPTGPKPEKPLISQFNIHENFTAEQVIDSIEYELSQYEYIGDAFPYYSMDCFGPGVVAAFLGCDINNDNGKKSIWFMPPDGIDDINDLSFKYNPDNVYLKRLKEIYKLAAERFEGKVILGMTDLGGVADILASFLGSENLMLEMYDNPEQVQKLNNDILNLWHKFYDELCQDLKCASYGYSDWSGALSMKPSYVIQCDFCYMISNDMFKEFVFDTLKQQCSRLSRTIYHLDGVGELTHLDDILSIDKLNCVQWIQGAGQPPHREWMHIYNKIIGKGKLAQLLWATYDDLAYIAQNVENPGYLQYNTTVFNDSDRDFCIEQVKKLQGIRK